MVRVDVRSVSESGPVRSVVFQLGDYTAQRPRTQKFSRDAVLGLLRSFDALPPRRKRKDGKDFKRLLRTLEAGGALLEHHRQQPGVWHGEFHTMHDAPVVLATRQDNRAASAAREEVVAASEDRPVLVTESGSAVRPSELVMPSWVSDLFERLSSALEDGDREEASGLVAGISPDLLAQILDVNLHVAYPRNDSPELFERMWRVRDFLEAFSDSLLEDDENSGDSD